MANTTNQTLIFRFSHKDEEFGSILHKLNENQEEKADIIMSRARVSGGSTFNDLQHYLRLRSEHWCTKVDVSQVRCFHNERYLMGLQVTYRATGRDGRIVYSEGIPHLFNRGYYAYHGGGRSESTLELADDEFIEGLRLDQGEILDGVTFVTNKRECHFGGHGGSRYQENMMFDRPGAHRIIAFAGTDYGVMHRIGYYAEKTAWEKVGHLVMIRWLTEKKRAEASSSRVECTKEQQAVQDLVRESSYDIFRHVLHFLV